MSQHEYLVSRDIAKLDYPFYALVMAAMRQADSRNAIGLRSAFPAVWAELQARYETPGGILPDDGSPGWAVDTEMCGACPHSLFSHWEPGLGVSACRGSVNGEPCGCSKFAGS